MADDIEGSKKITNDVDKFWGLLNKLTGSDFFEAAYEFDLDPETVAEECGCKVVLPKANQLQIDIDCEEQYNFYRGRLNDLIEMDLLVVTEPIEEYPSKSGLPKRHITLTCNRDFSDAERVAIQFALGSDIIRETLNTLRLLDSGGKDAGSLFFESINDKKYEIIDAREEKENE